MSWLACRYIDKEYGAAKLIALYERSGQVTSAVDNQRNHAALRAVLGVSRQQFVHDWLQYVRATAA